MRILIKFFGLVLVALVISEFAARKLIPEYSDRSGIAIRDVREPLHHPFYGLPEQASWDGFRIAVLGNTPTFGMTPQEESFPTQMGYLFRTGYGLDAPLNVQALNLGMPGYSPTLSTFLLKEIQSSIKPHLVLLALDDFDPHEDSVYAPVAVTDDSGLAQSVLPGLPGVPETLIPAARNLKLLRFAYGFAASNFSVLGAYEKKLPDSVFTDKHNRLGHYQKEQWQAWEPAYARTLSFVDALHKHLRKDGIPLAVVNYPYPPLVTTSCCQEWRKGVSLEGSQIYSSPFHARVKAFAEERHIPYYDLTERLKTVESTSEIFREEDGIFTTFGNLVFARQLVRFLAPYVDPTKRL